MADKSFKLPDKKRYNLGTPTRELVGEYDDSRDEPAIRTHVSPVYAHDSLYSTVTSVPKSFKVGDLIGKATRLMLEERLRESIKN